MTTPTQRAQSATAIAQAVELGMQVLAEVNDQIDPNTQVDLEAVFTTELNNQLNNRGANNATS